MTRTALVYRIVHTSQNGDNKRPIGLEVMGQERQRKEPFPSFRKLDISVCTIVGRFVMGDFTLGGLIWPDYLTGDFTLGGLIQLD